ncbi:MAG TPA: STAS domain-containing protein [Pseudonocardia sp.]|uniref:STAS domain-containing protein n=1 Tax=Pseudonocardia sp. TaxID=60912 RepID=UPI002B4B14E7|nr:STAS domain-containing protein [Pseudonocardia sp.]HLU57430.1 STAS domain-containing protein [Pseudonocardia sp.]
MVCFDGAQLCVEVRSPWLCVVRVAGVLDQVALGRLAGLVATHVARATRPGHLVVDLGEVRFFATADLTALRHARDGATAAGIRLHLSGVSAREAVLPTAITAALGEFALFGTIEHAERELVPPPGEPDERHFGGDEGGRAFAAAVVRTKRNGAGP